MMGLAAIDHDHQNGPSRAHHTGCETLEKENGFLPRGRTAAVNPVGALHTLSPVPTLEELDLDDDREDLAHIVNAAIDEYAICGHYVGSGEAIPLQDADDVCLSCLSILHGEAAA